MDLGLAKQKIAMLEHENTELKKHVNKLAIENSMMYETYLAAMTKDAKWKYYHENKRRMRNEQGKKDCSWHEVKRFTDEEFSKKPFSPNI